MRLMPGMPVEVMILNRQQTFLQYMINPLARSLTKSIRDH